MSCSSIDLKGYLLGEADAAVRRAAEEHLAACAACREEHQRLSLTRSALLTVREEEIPRRIAFVSDKVFEPRWHQRLWQSGPRLGFAGAAMLSCAILFHAIYQPAPAGLPVAPTAAAANVEQRIEAEVTRRLETAVQKAVTAVEERQARRTTELLDAAEKRMQREHAASMAEANATFRMMNERVNYSIKMAQLASAERGDSQ
jgi:anti-sigma factor RsiW